MSEQLPETQRQQVDTLSALIVKHLRIARRNHMDSPLGKAANEHLRVLYAQVAELPEVVRNAIAAKAGI